MTDIYVGCCIIFAISTLCFFLGISTTRFRSPYLGNLTGILALVATIAYIVFFWDHVLLTRIVPFKNAIVTANWFPIGAGILSGVAWGKLEGKRRRWFVSGMMLLAAAFCVAWPMLGSPPQCEAQWDRNVCLQTAQSSCMAAAATTLLKQYKIETTEEEMARLCFTRKRGTNWLGLYRGISTKLKGTQYHAELFHETPKQLLRHSDPQILSCGLTPEVAAKHPEYQNDYGWLVGLKHGVVLLKRTEKYVFIGDPANGRERWSNADLVNLWDGRGLRIVDRNRKMSGSESEGSGQLVATQTNSK